MYTTKPLTLYQNSPTALPQPPDGPNSGNLVIQNDESMPTRFFGLSKDRIIKDVPFPQNKLLSIENTHGVGDQTRHSYDKVYLIPVINQPLSSNLYYAIKADGKHKGKAYASSKDEDKRFGFFVKDVKPRPFNHEDMYQQFKFSVTKTFFNTNMFKAKSIVPNAHAPTCLRDKGWEIKSKTPRNFTLGEARGINSSLRAYLPDFNFPISEQCSTPIVVGKWYCPFIFINEGSEKERIENSVFYEMTLEQRWERVFNVDNNGSSQEKVVRVDVVIPTQVVRLDGQRAEETYRNNRNAVVWFTGRNGDIGLSKLIVDRMMWEEEKVGFKEEGEKQVRVIKEEEYGGVNNWRSFGCYILVERFVLKRNNGSVVMTYDFMHTHKMRSKWE